MAGRASENDHQAFFNIRNSSTGNLLTIRGNGNIGIGNDLPLYPLNFSNATGQKISFWNLGGDIFGIGLQNALLQIHSGSVNDDIAFGQGSSSAFLN